VQSTPIIRPPLLAAIAVAAQACTGKEDDSATANAGGLTAGERRTWIPVGPPAAVPAGEAAYYSVHDLRGLDDAPTVGVAMATLDLETPECWPCTATQEGPPEVSVAHWQLAADCTWGGAEADVIDVLNVITSEQFSSHAPTAQWTPGTASEHPAVVITQPTSGGRVPTVHEGRVQPTSVDTEDLSYRCTVDDGVLQCGNQQYKSFPTGTEPVLDCEELQGHLR
jgi:hypothetical protein